MNFFKKLALPALLLASQTAFAQLYDLGQITPSSAISFETASTDGNYDFIDYFTFNLTADAASLFGSVPDIRVNEDGQQFRANITAVLLYAGELSFADPIRGDLDRSSEGFSFKNLKAGTYYFAVAGRQRAESAGNYTFNLAVTPSTIVSTVTEPETYALLLGGLGLMGLIARRKTV